MSNATSPAPLPNLSLTYGSLFTGVVIAACFQGILTLQTYVYYETFPEDSIYLKLLVGVVWCVDLIHLVFVGQATYHYLVSNWGNVAILGFSTWTFDSHLVMLGLATILCQSFFIRRIWIFSNRNIALLIFLITICSAVFIVALYCTVKDIQVLEVEEFVVLKPEVTALFTIGAASDVIIALLLCYYLRKQNNSSTFARTHSIIAVLIRYTVTTGLATSALAVACLISYFATPGSFIFIAMHFSLGRMYTNSLLATLNSRRGLREITESSSRGRVGKPTLSTRQTGTYKGPGVSIQIETVQEVSTSNRDPYSPGYKNMERTSDDDIELGAVASPTKIVSSPIGPGAYEIKQDWTEAEAK